MTDPFAPELLASHLAKSFDGHPAVDDVSFDIAPGEILGLLAPNGAGTTTTIKLITGLLTPDLGTVTVAGETATTPSPEMRRHIGYVPQDIALYLDLNARENLRFFGRIYGLRGKELAARTDEVLHLVELHDRADDRVDQFSGGMKRRLNIAAALLHRPSLLVLDEPTVGVDPQSRLAILDQVQALTTGDGVAVLYTTHYMEEADRICDRVAIMDRGRIVATGNRRDLVSLVDKDDRIELRASGNLEAFASACEDLPGVQRATVSEGAVHLLAREARGLLPSILATADRFDVELRSVEVIEPDLEAVFMHLTGTALRD
jgi:ABC-2 type transport system ATP-binding protein